MTGQKRSREQNTPISHPSKRTALASHTHAPVRSSNHALYRKALSRRPNSRPETSIVTLDDMRQLYFL